MKEGIKQGDTIKCRHGIAKVTHITSDRKQVYLDKFMCYQDIDKIEKVKEPNNVQ